MKFVFAKIEYFIFTIYASCVCIADAWRAHRKLLTPCFHFKLLEDTVGVISKNANILRDQLKSRVDGPEFDIHDYIEKHSLDVICGNYNYVICNLI